MIQNRSALTVSSFFSMFLLGIGQTIIGASARNIGLSPYQIGLMIAAQNLGYIISVTVSGVLSDSYEKPRLLFVGSVVLAVSFLTFYWSDLLFLNLIIMFFVGIGMGTYEGVADAMLLDIHVQKESLYINVNHFFVTLGSLMITLYLIFLQMNWRDAVIQSGIAVSVLAIFFFLARLESHRKTTEKAFGRIRFIRREKAVILLFLVCTCAAGLEIGGIGIITTFLMELRGFSQVTSKIGLIAFLGGIAMGRLTIGFLTRRDQLLHSLLIFFGFSTGFFAVFLFLEAYQFTYPIAFICGIMMSALLPTSIALGGLLYQEAPGTVIGLIKTAIPAGGIIIPLLLSILSKYLTLRYALIIFPAISGVGFLILFLNREQFRVPALQKTASPG